MREIECFFFWVFISMFFSFLCNFYAKRAQKLKIAI